MRIVAGAWRGRTLVAPPGQGTRPTADRVRQALFDMLMHTQWGGHAVIEDAVVLDVFAGTGALGLEALSRGAAFGCFIESDAAALRALRANVTACKAADRVEILARDALGVAVSPRHRRAGAGADQADHPWPDARQIPSPSMAVTRGEGSKDRPASLVFLDPPYGRNLVPRALTHLREAGRIASNALIVAETGGGETWRPEQDLLAERRHGAAQILIFRAT
jgi:16S rRNA (guanine966-N2)-methyltransferase